MLAPISYVFGISADKLSDEYSLEEITPMYEAATEFLKLLRNPYFSKQSQKQPQNPEYDEFSARFGNYRGNAP